MPTRLHKYPVLLSLAGAALLAMASLACADVSINVNLPAPVVVLPAPPHMVWLPKPSLYIAFESPHQIFFRDDNYYLYDHDVWYIGPGYGGPWARAQAKHLPPGLRKYRREQWEDYQREARPRYREDNDHDHRNFVGWKDKKEKKDKSGQWKRGNRGDDDDRGRDNGRGRDNDHGRGNKHD